MTKDEIVHHFRIPECDGRVRLCISNTALGSRRSKFLVSVEMQVGEAWAVVDGTLRGSFWTYEDAEKLARGMYKAIAKQGTEALSEESILKSIQ